MAFNWNNIGGSDALDTWLNGFKNAIKAFVNNFDGTNIRAASIANSKLAAPKARGTWNLSNGGNFTTTARSNIMTRKILNSDGATATYKIVGWSLSVNTPPAATAIVIGAAVSLAVKYNGATILTITINGTSLAYGTPIGADLSASPISIDSSAASPILTVDFATSATTDLSNLSLDLDWTLQHATT
jgi:hypothetical protein